MKKKLANTKCTVKLRKSEYRDEWYLIIDNDSVKFEVVQSWLSR